MELPPHNNMSLNFLSFPNCIEAQTRRNTVLESPPQTPSKFQYQLAFSSAESSDLLHIANSFYFQPLIRKSSEQKASSTIPHHISQPYQGTLPATPLALTHPLPVRHALHGLVDTRGPRFNIGGPLAHEIKIFPRPYAYKINEGRALRAQSACQNNASAPAIVFVNPP